MIDKFSWCIDYKSIWIILWMHFKNAVSNWILLWTVSNLIDLNFQKSLLKQIENESRVAPLKEQLLFEMEIFCKSLLSLVNNWMLPSWIKVAYSFLQSINQTCIKQFNILYSLLNFLTKCSSLCFEKVEFFPFHHQK